MIVSWISHLRVVFATAKSGPSKDGSARGEGRKLLTF